MQNKNKFTEFDKDKLSKKLLEEKKHRKAINRLFYILNNQKNFSIKIKLLSLFTIFLFIPSFGNELVGKWIFKSIKGPVFVSGVSGYKIPVKFNEDGTVEMGNLKIFNYKKYYEFDGNTLKLWIGKKSKRNFSTTVFKIINFDGNCYKLKYIKATVRNKYGALLCKD